MGSLSTIRVGTRGSKLAVAQTGWVIDRLRELAPEVDFTFQIIDARPHGRPLGDGIFVKQIEEALLDGAVDIGVHSLKDLPTAPVDGLLLAAIPARVDAREALVGSRLADLRRGATAGTSSPRRTAQLKKLRPDLVIRPLTGNIPTRIRKVKQGEYDAAMLAAAGLVRLGLAADQILPFEAALPAPGQGALAIEVRAGDRWTEELASQINDPATRASVEAERGVLAELGGGCLLPVSALGQVDGTALRLEASVISIDGTIEIRRSATGEADNAAALAAKVAGMLIDEGAEELLQ
jgi:hydroxymethylbilane synthase